MGSGELTATMVEVHKELLGMVSTGGKAVFLDTPAGFQLNVDQLSHRAVEYFRERIHHPISVASFKSKEFMGSVEAESAFQALREACYILIGPGSPTYAVRHWRGTPVGELLYQHIHHGGCLVAASAAALTVGRFTLPVYEIYKVGENPHWVEGMDILGRFGFNLAVIPHWNNAEGGTHDTRYCYMGEKRFLQLESMLPGDVSILGLDEHTACLMDLRSGTATVRGLGRIVYRRSGIETVLVKGERFPLDLLRGNSEPDSTKGHRNIQRDNIQPSQPTHDPFWKKMHRIEAQFHKGMEQEDAKIIVTALLELDQVLWQALSDREDPDSITQGRELLRDCIVLLGSWLERHPPFLEKCLAPLMGEILELRNRFRREKRWEDADAIRDLLLRADIAVEDTKEGTRWRYGPA